MQQVARANNASALRDAAGAVQLNAGGYGYGLGISQNCVFRHVVAHSGGLPGFGSQMRWLPEYGVGIIAFGNLTYTGWGRVIPTALEALAKTGGLQARTVQPSPALVEARNAVSQFDRTLGRRGWRSALPRTISFSMCRAIGGVPSSKRCGPSTVRAVRTGIGSIRSRTR